jgi:hypothetical protein
MSTERDGLSTDCGVVEMSVGGRAEGWWRGPDGQWNPPGKYQDTHDFDVDCGPVPAHRHPNGGGWVANTANVDETAFVGPSASVFELAHVLDSANISDNAWVRGEGEVSGNAKVSGDVVVDGNAVVSDYAEVSGDAFISGLATLYEHAQVGGVTKLIDPCCITGSTRIFGDEDDVVSDMLKCANGHEMYSGANFCPTCGEEKLRTPVRQSLCPECGTDAVAGASFCGACGCSLMAPRETGMRRTVSKRTGSGVTWDLSDWDDGIHGELAAALLQTDIPHSWRGTTLSAEPTYESQVDEILDDLCGLPTQKVRQGAHPSSSISTQRLAPTATTTTPAGAWLAIVGGVLISIGSLLPWIAVASVVSISRNAFQLGANESLTVDGPICILLGIVTLIIGITRLTGSTMPRFIQRSSIITGIAVGVLLILDWSGLHDLVNQINGTNGAIASIGYGYWVSGVGALVAIVGGLVLRTSD